jgi:hypothetical protein
MQSILDEKVWVFTKYGMCPVFPFCALTARLGSGTACRQPSHTGGRPRPHRDHGIISFDWLILDAHCVGDHKEFQDDPVPGFPLKQYGSSFFFLLCSQLVADDLVDLEDLDEPVLMFNLQDRYLHDEIYVCTQKQNAKNNNRILCVEDWMRTE